MLESLWVKNPWGKNRVDEMLAFVPPSQAEREHALSNFVKYAWGNAVFQKRAEGEHVLSSLSSMPGEVPFCKNTLKENMLCQVCLVKCRFAKTS